MLHAYGNSGYDDFTHGWDVQNPPPVPWLANDNARDWRDMVKAGRAAFSSNTYANKSKEIEISEEFTKCDLRGVEDEDDRDTSNLVYGLTQTFFDFSDNKPFWEGEHRIPFVISKGLRETIEGMVRFGDVSTLDVKKFGTKYAEHFLNDDQSLSTYMQKLTTEEEPPKPGSRGGSGRSSAGNSSNVEETPWTAEWIKTCSNKRLGQELVKDIATFKLPSNGLESQQTDWGHFLEVVGPDSKLKWVDTSIKDGWNGDSKSNRKQFGLSVLYGTSKKAVSEALVMLATRGHGDAFPPVFTPSKARDKWKLMHGELSVLENTWVAVDPTYKRTLVKPEQSPKKAGGKRKAGQIAEGSSSVSMSLPRTASITALETRIQTTTLSLCDDMVEFIDAQSGVTPDQVARDLAAHLTSSGTTDTEEVAKFMHVYAEEMMRIAVGNARPAASAVPASASVADARADLLEDTLVSVIRQERGVMNTDEPEEKKLFQFLAEKLMARGNPAAYSPAAWQAFKQQLQEIAFF